METEARNPRSLDLDLLGSLEIVRLINGEDQRVGQAVAEKEEPIARAVDGIASRLSNGGRLLYVGAGTSGRLGVLDAVECIPTFGVEPDKVQAVLAGGYEACYRAAEAAEDDAGQGERDLRRRDLTADDAVVGISAGGATPYTLGALRYAQSLGAFTVALSCRRDAPLSREADVAIEVEVGPEVLAGSTRMKAGTAQKMILNTLSTAVMVRLGYAYSNLMVNLRPTNEKLIGRAVGIIREITGATPEEALAALERAGDVRSAVVLITLRCSPEQARERARTGNLREILGKLPE